MISFTFNVPTGHPIPCTQTVYECFLNINQKGESKPVHSTHYQVGNLY